MPRISPESSQDDVHKEIRRLQRSFSAFCALLVIYDEESNAIQYKPNRYQKSLLGKLKDGLRKFLLHKSRQLGNSTGIAAYLFFCALFTPRFRVAVVAQTHPAVMGIAEIYKRFVEHLPDWLVEFYGVEAMEREIRFKHGGYIRFFTAGTDSVRGQNYQALHLSEVAFWVKPERTFAGIMSAAKSPKVLLFLESTANGQNHWYHAWNDLPGFVRMFFTWVDDKTLDVAKNERKEYDTIETPKHILALMQNLKLTVGQVRWAKKQYYIDAMGSVSTFRQEQPTTAEEAFILSGDRVFQMAYLDGNNTAGVIEFAPPEEFVPYTLGADIAGGSTSPTADFSAIKVLDTRVSSAPVEAWSFYGKLPPLAFARMIHLVSKRYKTISVVERNSFGIPVLEALEHMNKKGDYELYTEETRNTVGKKITNRLGFWTGENSRKTLFAALMDFIDNQRLRVIDPRLKHEVNTCVWNGGRPEADEGAHDDMLIATAMALMGIPQVRHGYKTKKIFAKEPRTLHEILVWEGQTGLRVIEHVDKFAPSEWEKTFGERVDSASDDLLGI